MDDLNDVILRLQAYIKILEKEKKKNIKRRINIPKGTS